jgi:hypothetical protein
MEIRNKGGRSKGGNRKGRGRERRSKRGDLGVWKRSAIGTIQTKILRTDLGETSDPRFECTTS